MPTKNTVLEIRLDRRQAFYAIVGLLLVIAVVFVVGIIMGQRMYLADAELAQVEAQFEQSVQDIALAQAPIVEPIEEIESPYTFYDELNQSPSRPNAQLLMSPEEALALESESAMDDQPPPEQPAHEETTETRRLDRTPVSDPTSDSQTENVAVVTSPVEDTEPTPPPVLPIVQPVNEPEQDTEETSDVVANVDTPPSEPGRIVRRSVVVTDDESEAPSEPDEFGYFTVEAGRYDTFDQASETRDQLWESGHQASITVIDNGVNQTFSVQVGSFTRRSRADNVADEVSRLGFRASVVQES